MKLYSVEAHDSPRGFAISNFIVMADSKEIAEKAIRKVTGRDIRKSNMVAHKSYLVAETFIDASQVDI